MLCAKYSYKDDIRIKQRDAFNDGKEAMAKETAKNALKMNLTFEQISQITGLSVEEIKKLSEEM